MSIEHKTLEYLKSRFEDGDRPTGEDFKHLLDSCHNTEQDTDVKITGSLTVNDTTLLEQPTTLDASLTTKGPATFKSTLHVDGAAHIAGTLRLSDDLTVNALSHLTQGVMVDGTAVFGSTLNVNGSALISNILNVSDDVTVGGSLTVSGDTLIKNTTTENLTVTENLTNTGSLATFQNVHIKGDIRVDGNAYLSAGSDGVISVGDTSGDNVSFVADVNSDINVNLDKQYNLGSVSNKWANVFANYLTADTDVRVGGSVVVAGEVDGRKISIDGEKLDELYTSMNDTSANWDSAHSWGDHAAPGYWVDQPASREQWNQTYTSVKNTSANWDSAHSWGDHAAAGYWLQDDDKINNWDSTHTTMYQNSAQWDIDKLVDFVDVDSTGVENNSILRYESSTEKWIASTVEDEVVKATAQLLVYDHGSDNEIPVNGLTLTLVDNYQDGPYRTVTFTADSHTLSGEYTKVDANNYTYGTSGLSAAPTDKSLLADIVATAINTANNIGDISIKANSNNGTITLQQEFGGPGGNTQITGTATGNAAEAFLHGVSNQHNPAFDGGANLNSFASLDDTPAGYGSDQGKFVKVDAGGTGLEFVEHNTSGWDDVYTTVTTSSGSWEESADIDSIVSSISGVSGDWNTAHSWGDHSQAGYWVDDADKRAEWDSTYTSVSTTSANWDNTYTAVSQTSANWNEAYNDYTAVQTRRDAVITQVESNSADWNTVYSDVSTTSGKWDSVFNLVNTTSGEGYAVVDANGKLLTDQIPELSITRVHVVQNPGDVVNLNPVEGIQVGDVVIVVTTFDNLIAVDTAPGNFGTYESATESYVGYNKLALPADLVQTINGNTGPHVVLSTDDINEGSTNKYVTDQLIAEWNNIATVVKTTSADWEETADIDIVAGDLGVLNTFIDNTSGEWNDTYNVVSTTSANWNNVYSDVSTTSANWNNVYTDVSTTSANWDSVYSFVHTDSATNNTNYNRTTFVNVTGDTMTGDLHIDGGELEVGGNVTLAGDVIHQSDTGTRMSFNPDIITLETNGQEYVTIDGTSNKITINDPAVEPIQFVVKSKDRLDALSINGSDGNVGIGMAPGTENLSVSGDAKFSNNVEVLGDIDSNNVDVTQSVTVGDELSVTNKILSAGVELHDIFTTETDVHGDLTVHGSVSADGDIISTGSQYISGDTTIAGGLSADSIRSATGLSTIDTTGKIVTGVTQDVNIGGHVLHIVNGLIIGVTDE